jgi:WD40 repeat protein
VSVSGGVAIEVTRPDPVRREISHRWPNLLPDGKHAFMTVLTHSNESGVERSAAALLSLDTGQWRTLVEPAADARYLASGHIVFARENVLLRAPVDPGRMEIAGVETPILPDLRFRPGPSLQVPWAASRSGTVVAYIPSGAGKFGLDFVALDGTRTEAATETLTYRSVSFSPDGERAAVAVFVREHVETWTLDVRRKLLSRLGASGGGYPAWSPDGRRLALVQDLTRLVVRRIDEESKPELWVTHDSNITIGSWTPDGLSLLYAKRDGQNYDVFSKSLDGDEKILLGEPFRETSPRLTADGHWLAYQSNENGRFEVFVRAFPSLAHKLQVSTAGAAQPIWSPDGHTLYYLSDDSLVAASLALTPGGGFVLVSSKTLFPISFAAIGNFGRIYDISPDGERFLFIVDRAGTAPEIRVVLNGLLDPGAR